MHQDAGSTDLAAPPAVLPVFPLTGSLLLPGTYLPLNVFERRYRNLVEDVLESGRHLGMIQPLIPGPDNFGLDRPCPELYRVGCAGLLERAEPQADGRYLTLIRGIARFRVEEELAVRRGYRRVRASYRPFAADLEGENEGIEPAVLLAGLERFGDRHDLEFDLELLASLDALRLLNALCASLPFEPAEQQALLEAGSARHRQALLLELMSMGTARQPRTVDQPPTVH